MDKLQNDIRASKSTLITAKNNLASLEREATTDLSSHVETVRKQLKLADRDLLHTTIQAQSFLSQLELVPKASTSVDLEQQVLWVIDRLEAVLGHLNNAHQSVDNTISSTNIYVYKVMDIGEDVESKDRELSTHQLAANTLSTNAEAKLKTYQSNLEKLERKIREKEAEVKTKAADARYKRQRQSQLTAQIKNARCKAEEAQRERERRNKHAKRGAVRGFSTLYQNRIRSDTSPGFSHSRGCRSPIHCGRFTGSHSCCWIDGGLQGRKNGRL